jgi:hypothetical protein
MLLLYPFFIYCVGIALRSIASSLILKDGLPHIVRLFLFVCADIVAMASAVLLLDEYVSPFLFRMAAEYGVMPCRPLWFCTFYWHVSVLADLIAVLVIFLAHGVLVRKARIERATAAAKAKFVAVYLGIAVAILVTNYLVYPFVDAELQSWKGIFPERQR